MGQWHVRHRHSCRGEAHNKPRRHQKVNSKHQSWYGTAAVARAAARRCLRRKMRRRMSTSKQSLRWQRGAEQLRAIGQPGGVGGHRSPHGGGQCRRRAGGWARHARSPSAPGRMIGRTQLRAYNPWGRAWRTACQPRSRTLQGGGHQCHRRYRGQCRRQRHRRRRVYKDQRYVSKTCHCQICGGGSTAGGDRTYQPCEVSGKIVQRNQTYCTRRCEPVKDSVDTTLGGVGTLHAGQCTQLCANSAVMEITCVATPTCM